MAIIATYQTPKGNIAVADLHLLSDEILQSVELSHEEQFILGSYTHEFRKRQWLAVRYLTSLFEKGASISYSESGKPYLTNSEKHISVSHSGDLIALYISNSPCGIDIEKTGHKVQKIAPKFMNDEEILSASDSNIAEIFLIYWVCKEAAYKVEGSKGVSLRNNIFVHHIASDQSNETAADILIHGHKTTIKIHFERFREYMIAWTI
ncbi:MAG: hypothetical protein Fur0041_09580 [Bacteroidia bacterium]